MEPNGSTDRGVLSGLDPNGTEWKHRPMGTERLGPQLIVLCVPLVSVILGVSKLQFIVLRVPLVSVILGVLSYPLK